MADIQEVGFNYTQDNVAIVGTTETAIITTPRTSLVRQTMTAFVLGWVQMITGTNTTTVSPRLRRGATIAGTLISENNAEGIKVAVGVVETFLAMAIEELSNIAEVRYTLSAAQAGATANGATRQQALIVLLM